MISDKQMCDFLYSMLAQLEVRNIDWSIVANEHGISNAHAARMRWHRFSKAKTGHKPRARVSKKATKDGLEERPDMRILKSSFGAKGDPRSKGCMSADVCMEDDDDEELLDLTRSRVKMEHRNSGHVAWDGIVKQEDLDFKLPPRVWNRTPMLSPPPMQLPMHPSTYNSPQARMMPTPRYFSKAPAPEIIHVPSVSPQPPPSSEVIVPTCYRQGLWTTGDNL